jgi:hypothetical protein
LAINPKRRSRREQIHVLGGQGLLSRSGKAMDHIRIAILEDHLEQDRGGVHEYGFDLVRVLSDLSCSLEGSGDVFGGIVVGHVLSTEDIFNRADGLDEVLLDCWT